MSKKHQKNFIITYDGIGPEVVREAKILECLTK